MCGAFSYRSNQLIDVWQQTLILQSIRQGTTQEANEEAVELRCEKPNPLMDSIILDQQATESRCR